VKNSKSLLPQGWPLLDCAVNLPFNYFPYALPDPVSIIRVLRAFLNSLKDREFPSEKFRVKTIDRLFIILKILM